MHMEYIFLAFPKIVFNYNLNTIKLFDLIWSQPNYSNCKMSFFLVFNFVHLFFNQILISKSTSSSASFLWFLWHKPLVVISNFLLQFIMCQLVDGWSSNNITIRHKCTYCTGCPMFLARLRHVSKNSWPGKGYGTPCM